MALLAAQAHKDIHVFCDSFADVDRGYFVRQGVVDRLYNPRTAFHVLRHLPGALAQAESEAWAARLSGAEILSPGWESDGVGSGDLTDLQTGERWTGIWEDLKKTERSLIWTASP